MLRQEFLHTHMVELEAEMAKQARAAIAEENVQLKQELQRAQQLDGNFPCDPHVYGVGSIYLSI